MGRATAISLDALRARIRELEGAPVHHSRVSTGVDAVDRLIGGLPSPGVTEICGPLGSGATRLAIGIVASYLRRGHAVAWVDVDRALHPPSFAALGVDLTSLLIVQPPGGREVWAVEQALRAGCFAVVAVSGGTGFGRAGFRWGQAAEAGRCSLVAVRRELGREFPSDVRLGVGHGEVWVVRNRGGRSGGSRELPMRPRSADPWGTDPPGANSGGSR